MKLPMLGKTILGVVFAFTSLAAPSEVAELNLLRRYVVDLQNRRMVDRQDGDSMATLFYHLRARPSQFSVWAIPRTVFCI